MKLVKLVGIEINIEKTGRNQDIKVAIRSFENVAHFEYLGMTARDKI
jgi:hypothetical protein